MKYTNLNYILFIFPDLVAPDDTPKDVELLANKILKLKVWDSPSDGGRWKMSAMDMDYQVLLVSQFTLLAKTKKGSKPDFHGACPPALAADIYTSLLDKTRALYAGEKGLAQEDAMTRVQDGVFGAMMQVALVNDGPVTFELSTPEKSETVTSNKGGKKEKSEGEGKGDTGGNVISNSD